MHLIKNKGDWLENARWKHEININEYFNTTKKCSPSARIVHKPKQTKQEQELDSIIYSSFAKQWASNKTDWDHCLGTVTPTRCVTTLKFNKYQRRSCSAREVHSLFFVAQPPAPCRLTSCEIRATRMPMKWGLLRFSSTPSHQWSDHHCTIPITTLWTGNI